MKNDENREIGELIREITEKGWVEMMVDILPASGDHSPFACVCVTNHDLPDDENTISVEAEDLAECLRIIVDSIRRKLGEPTLAEEV